jgi:hypothetical protein
VRATMTNRPANFAANTHRKPVFLSEVAAVKIGITPDETDGRAVWASWSSGNVTSLT